MQKVITKKLNCTDFRAHKICVFCVHHGLVVFVNPGESAGQRVKFVFVLFCFICLFLFMLALFVCLFSEFASTPRCQPTPSDTEKMMHNNLPTDNIRT